MADKRYYLACLDLEDRSCLVVGAGTVALEKLRGLLDAGARVTVVAPEALDEVEQLAGEWLAREYRSSDLDGRFLVVAATQDRRVNAEVSRDAEARNLPCNVADDPELCSFILPAIHRSGPIAVGVTTGGASPALAQRIRDELAERYGEEHAQLARRLAALRPWAKQQLPSYEARREYFRRLVDEALA
ncbi:MAG: precorrin-2 dehydrogenase/sirohydrochlorin ferrochelatase family protein [Gaiellaceae bacterium]